MFLPIQQRFRFFKDTFLVVSWRRQNRMKNYLHLQSLVSITKSSSHLFHHSIFSYILRIAGATITQLEPRMEKMHMWVEVKTIKSPQCKFSKIYSSGQSTTTFPIFFLPHCTTPNYLVKATMQTKVKNKMKYNHNLV